MATTTIKAYGATAATADLKPLDIERRAVGKGDIKIEILYCGVCHSDIHTVRNDWKNASYPVVPGHEIVGRVVETGDNVKKFKVDDIVGVGCLVDSCQDCASCDQDLEQFCENGPTFTYNSPDNHIKDQRTYGGYSQNVVVDEKFVLRIPENLDKAGVAPLLCAGITTWSPLSQYNVKKGDKVGIVGLGGLGHMGVKFAHALGAQVIMITTSPDKGKDAKRLGADEVLISKEEDAMKKHRGSFDFILNTIPVGHEMDPYLTLLKINATMVLVGAIDKMSPFQGGNIIMGSKRVAGSFIGGIKETQEMLDFCGKHDIICDFEMIDMKEINNAYERVTKNDVKYRFVIDMKSLK